MSEEVDVVVVGAGFAGLVAARTLRSEGREVQVLEARDRPGGRVHTIERGGCRLEMGASFLGPGQEPLKQLARDFGMTWTQRAGGGQDLYYTTPDGSDEPDRILDSLPYDVGGLLEAVAALDALARHLAPGSPWETPGANELDRQTFAGWVEKNVAEGAREPIYLAHEGFVGDRNEVSLLHALHYSRANGGYAALLGLTDPPHDHEVFVGGGGTLAMRIAEELGGRLRLSSPVVSISQDRDRVHVASERGNWSARYAIVAMPPAVAGRIQFTPELPPDRRRLSMRYQTQAEAKCHLVYERPFWRDLGLSGAVYGDGAFMTFDATVGDGPGVLTAFQGFGQAGGRDDEEAREKRMRARVTRFFGEEASKPIAYADHSWLSESWTLGCVHFAPPGMWTSCGTALRKPFKRVVWAGAETSPEMPGQMDGAVRSGQRAASEVLSALGEEGA